MVGRTKPKIRSQQVEKTSPEFAANNAVNVSTGYSPFYLNSGDHPILPSDVFRGDRSASVEAVQEMTDRMKVALEEAQANLSLAQRRARTQANKSRRDEEFKVGEEVVLSTKNLKVDQHLPSKFKKRWIGPFRIAKVVSPVAYGLDLPPDWKIHPTFHISNLKRFFRSEEFTREEQPPPPVIVEGVEEYEVESILRHKGRASKRRYLVLWKGYPLTEASWEPESNLRNAPEVLEDYLCRIANPPKRQSRNRGSRKSG